MEISDIKAHMKKYKITYAKLAEMTGINLTTIKRIFCGKTQTPHLETIVAIEQALGFINTNSQYTGTMHEGATLTEKEKALLKAFKNLLPETQDFILRTAQNFATDGEKSLKKS